MIAAVSLVKDEADVIEATVTRMCAQADLVIVADNGSTDGTRDILARLPVRLLDEPDPAYYQSRRMTALAEIARSEGADWVVPFDADEVWLARSGSLPDVLDEMPDLVLVVEAELYDHVPTALDPGGCPVERIRYRRPSAGVLPKVAVRALPGLTISQGNHGATFDGVDDPPTLRGELEVRHFPYRTAEQFVRKAANGAAAYAATDLPDDVGAHWRGYGRILDESGPEALADVFREYFWAADPDAAGLIADPCP